MALMDRLQQILHALHSQTLSPEEAERQLKAWPFQTLEDITIDTHRNLRKGFPEVIFGESKSLDQLIRLTEAHLNSQQQLLITRINETVFTSLQKNFPSLIYHSQAKIVASDMPPDPQYPGTILVLSGGSSDIPVASEAVLTAQYLGNKVETLYDVGVAGLQRLLSHITRLQSANVIIVAAGMEGALTSVVAGLVSTPVIGLPTSIGYGTALKGFTPLMAMLTGCAEGVGVVNIDNGFGAGYLAASINRTNLKTPS